MMIYIKQVSWIFLVIISSVKTLDIHIQNTTISVCQKESNNNDTCISINSCPLAKSLLEDKNNQDSVKKLRSMTCGFENNFPLVCCPSENSNSNETKEINNNVTATTTPRPVTTTPAIFTSTSPAPDLLKALPDRTICSSESDIDNRIKGGEPTAIHEFPWLVRIKYIDDHNIERYACSGSLISDRYVLTAAHCFSRMFKVSEVRLGEWNAHTDKDCYDNKCNEKPVDVNVENVIVYPHYNRSDYTKGDIALLRLEGRVNFTEFIKPICLPTTEYIALQDYIEGSTYTTAGWGLTEFEEESVVKRKIDINAVATPICQVAYSNIPKEAFSYIICAGGKKDIDTCGGDSGGPLFRLVAENNRRNYFLYGITSVGKRQCGAEGYPGLYTRVTAYMSWILENIQM